MTSLWWTPVWQAADFGPIAPEPPQPELFYNPWEPAVIQTADWTCSCASSAWLLNAAGDERLGRAWNEWDVVDALRTATYPGAVDPAYGLARADMYDLQVMFAALGYRASRQLYVSEANLHGVAGVYPVQINGAAWYHHSGVRAFGEGVLLLANPAPAWKGVGQELDRSEASRLGSWNMLALEGRL